MTQKDMHQNDPDKVKYDLNQVKVKQAKDKGQLWIVSNL